MAGSASKERPVNLRSKRTTKINVPQPGVIGIRLGKGRRGHCLVLTLPDGSTIWHEVTRK